MGSHYGGRADRTATARSVMVLGCYGDRAPGGLRKFADAFGLVYFAHDNQIAHSMDIVLISPQGTIAKSWSTDWTTKELEDALRQQAAQSASAALQTVGAGRSR